MKIRNIAIIAHVDHGKTTLVDELLKQSGTFRENQNVEVRVMDSNDLEKERGITILAKCTSVHYKDYKINIIDTPGHADFGGEVERILGMVEGVILLVDSQEGPMPQTRFVTSKALSLGLKPIVLINKMDKPDRRPDEVYNEVFDLFVNLGATDEQLDFPILYAAARDGWVSTTEEKEKDDVSALFETVIAKIEEPKVDTNSKFAMVSTMIENDDYVGRMLTGKIASGKVKVGDNLKALDRDGNLVEKSKVSKLMLYEGLSKKSVDEVFAGDIVCLAGFSKATVSDTICDVEVEDPLYAKPIDPPVLSMTFSVNDSPYAGKDGKKLTSRVIRERLLKEQEINVSIKIQDTDNADTLEVSARGELQLAILIETMRREGFELSIGRPRVLIKEEDGVKKEPMEYVQVDVDQEFAGTIIDTLQKRKARIDTMSTTSDGKQRIVFIAPTRGLIGYYSKFLTDTRGTGVMSRLFYGYEEWKGAIESRFNGVLISMAQGKSVAYGLFHLEDRGKMFIGAGEDVYVGMIIGEHAKDNDLEVNPIKAKQLSNMRAAGKDDNIILTPPKRMSLEEAISYIEEDEMIEVTPNFLRVRKKYLDPNERKKYARIKVD
ncbi:MAG: translational GTPase TypA [Alphaproteobacteria bacterium]|jgi:GTP-binding protein|nr:translational GTPase TypA [Alphaproteobacteria bacterium]